MRLAFVLPLVAVLATCDTTGSDAPDALVCTGKPTCYIDGPCGQMSVCPSGNTVQVCITKGYNGPSADCVNDCFGNPCCTGASCEPGTITCCPSGTVCMEGGTGILPSTKAACQPVDGGLDLLGWGLPPDGGHQCHWGL